MSDRVLTDAEVADGLAALDGWTVDDAGLHRSLRFADFAEAFAFMTRVALAAERLDHHPDWSNSWNRVDIAITNHAAGGVTSRCFELATAIAAAAR